VIGKSALGDSRAGSPGASSKPARPGAPTAEVLTARGALAAAVLDGRIHALGGAGDRPLDSHEVYDPATDTWTTRSAMPTPRDHLAVVSLGGQLFAISGRRSFFGQKYAHVEIYDPATDSWQTAVPLPVAR
jgi:hypothetical protein